MREFWDRLIDAARGLLATYHPSTSHVIVAAVTLLILVLMCCLVWKDRKIMALAARNVFRNKRRTRLTVLIAATGVTSLMIFGGYAENAFFAIRENTIRGGMGHLQLYSKGYHEKGAVDKSSYTIGNYDEIRKMIETDPVLRDRVEAVGAELEVSGIVSSEDASSICVGRGVEPSRDSLLSATDTIVEGKMFSNDATDVGLVGKGLFSSLGMSLGDYGTLLVTKTGGSLNAVDFQVVGVVQSGVKEYDDTLVKLPIGLAWRLMGTEDVTRIVILLKETMDTDLVAERWDELIEEKGLDIEYRTWSDLAVYYHAVVGINRGIFSFVRAIIAVIVVFAIGNTLAMSVMERVQEIGSLRAMGCTKSQVLKMFLAEGVVLGVLGGVLGVVCGLLIAEAINLAGGMQMPPPPGRTLGYVANIDAKYHPMLWLQSFGVVLVTAFISSIFPARRAAKMDIADALRHY